MGEALLRQRRFVSRGDRSLGAVGGERDDCLRAVRPGHDLGHGQGRAGRRRSRRDRDRDEPPDATGPHDRHRRQRLLHVSQPTARPLRHRLSSCRASRRPTAPACSSTPPVAFNLDFTLETGALTEEVTVTAESVDAADATSRCARRSRRRTSSMLSFSGRNPIGVPALKAGVIGGSFNNAGFIVADQRRLQHQRRPRQTRTHHVDGAVAIRTRSSGAMIGVQNADAVQEVQVLTANYMPEYGRASGGQIRFVTKSGSNRYSRQRVVLLPRRLAPGQHLGAQSQPERDRELRPGAVRLQAVRLLVRRSDSRRDVQGQAVLLRRPGVGRTSSRCRPTPATVPTASDAPRRLQRAARGRTPSSARAQIIRDPLTGQPFPGQHHPDRAGCRANGMAIMKPVSGRRPPGFQQGTNNAIFNSENPQDQRKDNIRFDYRLNDKQPVHATATRGTTGSRSTRSAARSRSRAPTGSGRITTQNFNWTQHHRQQPDQRVQLRVLARRSVHQRVHRERACTSGAGPGSTTRTSSRPARRSTTRSRPSTSTTSPAIDGGPYPSSSQRADHDVLEHDDLREGPPHVQGRRRPRVLGRGRLRPDQRQLDPRRHEQPERPVRFPQQHRRAPARASASPTWRSGCSPNYAELGERAFTKWRALATDIFIQDSWKPTANLTIEGGVRWAIWPPWYSTTNNIANFDPRFYDPANAAVINPATGRIVSGRPLQRHRPAGRRLRGRGQRPRRGAGSRRCWRSSAVSRAASRRPTTTCSSRGSASRMRSTTRRSRALSTGVFHNRVTLNDSTLLGGNPPFQPMVTWCRAAASDNPSAAAAGGASDLPFGMQAQEIAFKHPTVVHCGRPACSARCRSASSSTSPTSGRRGLYLQRERNINQLQTRARSRPTRREHRGAAALQGLRRAPHRRERRPLALQQPAAQRGSPLQQRPQGGRRVHARQVRGQRQRQARRALEHLRRHQLLGGVELRPPARAVASTTSTTCRSGVTRRTLVQNLARRLADLRRERSCAPARRSRSPATNDIAGRRRRRHQPAGGHRRRSERERQRSVLGRAPGRATSCFNPAAFANPAAGTFGNSDAQHPAEPGRPAVGPRALQELRRWHGQQKMQFRVEMFNFSTTRT